MIWQRGHDVGTGKTVKPEESSSRNDCGLSRYPESTPGGGLRRSALDMYSAVLFEASLLIVD